MFVLKIISNSLSISILPVVCMINAIDSYIARKDAINGNDYTRMMIVRRVIMTKDENFIDSWFFNTRFDNDLLFLKNLHRRTNALSNKDSVPDKTNKLWISWSNAKAMLNKDDVDYYKEVMYFTAVMAKKIDDYAVNNMLNGDSTVARILYELDSIKSCAYELLEVRDVTSGQ